MINPFKKLAEDINIETYNETPIESYGMNILKKMSNNSKNNNLNRKRKPPDVIEFKPRNHRSGLGYEIDSKIINKANEASLISYYGVLVKVTKGKYKGQKGKIISLEKSDSFSHLLSENDYLMVQLETNAQKIQIETSNIEKCEEIQQENINKQNTHTQTNTKVKLTWLTLGITVRIINSSSKYYNTKAKVEDIYDLYTFALLTQDGTLHTEFNENDLETVIPKIGEDAMIISGEHKGEIGKLLYRDKKQNIVNIQLFDDLSVITLTQDDVCMLSK